MAWRRILLSGPLGTNFSEILIKIYTFSFRKMHFKMLFEKWRPFCFDLNVLNLLYLITAFTAVYQQYSLLLQIVTFVWNFQSFIEIIIDIPYTIPGHMPLFSYVHDYKGFYLHNMGYCCPPIRYVTLVTIAEFIVLVPYHLAEVIAANFKIARVPVDLIYRCLGFKIFAMTSMNYYKVPVYSWTSIQHGLL